MSTRRRMMSRNRGSERFIRLPFYLVRSPAWHALDATARAIYLELLLRFNGSNNGSIGLGIRDAGDAVNVKKSTAARAFNDLRRLGFVDVGQGSSFAHKRLAREWLLTDLYDDRNGKPARKDFMRWRPEKQKPVPPSGHIVPPSGHTGNQIPQNEGGRDGKSVLQSRPADCKEKAVSHQADTYRSTIRRVASDA